VLVGQGEEVLGGVHASPVHALRVAEAAGEHGRVDAGVVQVGDELLDRAVLRQVLAEQPADRGVLLPRAPGGGEALGEEVDPRVEHHDGELNLTGVSET